MRRRFRVTGLAAAVTLFCAGQAPAEPVALTFDDIPLLGLRETPAEAQAVTRRLTRELRACRIPATGFVIGDKLEDHPRVRARILREWRAAGFALGNHTYSHLSLNATDPDAYIADIARNDRLLSATDTLRRGETRWFRHPYLETGQTEAKRAAVEGWLSAHGYRIAPVTLENDDDIFAAPYEDAVSRRDRRAAQDILNRYLALTEARVAWYRAAGQALFGRAPGLVFLMHASALNAAAMPRLCGRLRQLGLQPAPLAEVMADPAYQLPEGPVTDEGDDWLNRWAVVLKRDLPWDDFPEAPADIQATAKRLDPDEP